MLMWKQWFSFSDGIHINYSTLVLDIQLSLQQCTSIAVFDNKDNVSTFIHYRHLSMRTFYIFVYHL